MQRLRCAEESSQEMVFELRGSRVTLKIADIKGVCYSVSNC